MAEVAPPAVTGVVLVEVVPPQVLSVCTICSGSRGTEKPGHPWCAGGREGELLCAAAALLCALQALHQHTSARGSFYFLFLERTRSGLVVSGPSRAGWTCPLPGFSAGAHAGAAVFFSLHRGWGEQTCSRNGRWILF